MTKSYRISIQLLEFHDDGRSVNEEPLEETGCAAYETLVPLETFKSIFNLLKIVLTEQWNRHA
jgi:hypothetical protein